MWDDSVKVHHHHNSRLVDCTKCILANEGQRRLHEGQSGAAAKIKLANIMGCIH